MANPVGAGTDPARVIPAGPASNLGEITRTTL
jgi:hypothetical protein